jgi:ribosomal protein S18 acetylase RimI-like enzyme
MQSKYSMPALTSELLDQIIFAMENQDTESCLDLKEALVTERDAIDADEDEEDRYLDLPDWTSADGFRLMEKFIDKVRNPYYRDRLSTTLQGGKGVFRRFKDVLSEQGSLLQAWYGFKQHEMEKVVTAWYREERGAIALSGSETDEDQEGLGDLLLEDFSVEFAERGGDGDALFSRLLSDGGIPDLVTRNLRELSEKRYVFARSAAGEICGMMIYGVKDNEANLVFYGVDATYRGMGLFRLMFDAFARQMARQKVTTITADFGFNQQVLSLFGSVPLTDVFRRVAIPLQSYVQQAKNSEEVFV